MPYKEITKNKRNTIILIVIFSLFIMGLGYAMSVIVGDYIYIGIAFAVTLIMNILAYFQGDKIILKMNSAKGITKKQAPELYRVVENLAITAGLPTPKIYIIQDPSPNAFATGRNPENASVTVTTGLLKLLNKNELEGVIAHELSHIKNYDVRLAMMVIMLVGITVMLSDFFFRISFFRNNKKKGGGPIILIIAIVLAILSPIVAKIIQLAISRQREFLADADSVLLTRYPEGLASALEKISQQNLPMKKVNKVTANLFIANPFGNKKSLTKRLFATHPPVKERINKLNTLNF